MPARLAVAAALALTIALLPTAASAASSLTLTPAEGASGTWIVAEGTCPIPDGAADAGGLWVDAAALVGGEELGVRSTFDETDASGRFSMLIQLLDFEGTGMSIIEALNDMRIRQAALLLEHTNRNSSEVANDVGYHNYNHFMNQFRKRFGVGPSAYAKLRRQARNKMQIE